jgi:hypothetical protein
MLKMLENAVGCGRKVPCDYVVMHETGKAEKTQEPHKR